MDMPPPPPRPVTHKHSLDENMAHVLTGHYFTQPSKRITTQILLNEFQLSWAYRHVMEFIALLNESVSGKSLTVSCHVSDSIRAIRSILDELDAWIDEYPPVQQPMRFGNKAFRTWHERLSKEALALCRRAIPDALEFAAEEVSVYLIDSFGNPTRIDYGTGHENTFICFLCCMRRLRVFGDADAFAVVQCVFAAYVRLMRRLQTTYQLEPAGSHGVWGLDDYCFLPLLLGASQLRQHETIKPHMIANRDLVRAMADQYLYLEAIDFIYRVKTGQLAENSPMLWDISAVPSWEKVNSGLIKMYAAEVLHKLPVIQHFLFGSILSFAAAQPQPG